MSAKHMLHTLTSHKRYHPRNHMAMGGIAPTIVKCDQLCQFSDMGYSIQTPLPHVKPRQIGKWEQRPLRVGAPIFQDLPFNFSRMRNVILFEPLLVEQSVQIPCQVIDNLFNSLKWSRKSTNESRKHGAHNSLAKEISSLNQLAMRRIQPLTYKMYTSFLFIS